MRPTTELFRKAVPTLRKPTSEDGAAIWDLIRSCPPLDCNSMYCNLIQCDHFRDTCVVAERDGEIVGWISGYVVPDADDTFFVWQVAVSEKARGTGLGTLMLDHLMDRPACKDVTRLQTTITRDNAGSWALFRKFAKGQGGELGSEEHFTRDDHFDGKHQTEFMVTITMPEAVRKAA